MSLPVQVLGLSDERSVQDVIRQGGPPKVAAVERDLANVGSAEHQIFGIELPNVTADLDLQDAVHVGGGEGQRRRPLRCTLLLTQLEKCVVEDHVCTHLRRPWKHQ